MATSPTRDIATARAELDDQGYTILANALDQSEITNARERLIAQADAEKRLGKAFEDGGPDQQWGAFIDAQGQLRRDAFREENGGINQRVWMLVNKGQVFLDLLEKHDVLSVVRHVLGDELLLSSHTANIAKPGGVHMPLHTDQWWMPQPTRPDRRNLPVGSITRSQFDFDDADPDDHTLIAPAACCNVIWMLDDFAERNGATRIVPGSHRYGRHPDPVKDADIETVAVCAPAGSALVTDGRVWHGTGANVGATNRNAVLTTFCGPQFRPQENFVVGTHRSVIDDASPDLLALLGFKVWWGYGRTGNPTEAMIDRDQMPLGVLTVNKH